MTMMTTTTRKETAKKCRKSHSKLYMSMSLALAVVVLLGICTVSESFLDEARTIQNHYAIQMPHLTDVEVNTAVVTSTSSSARTTCLFSSIPKARTSSNRKRNRRKKNSGNGSGSRSSDDDGGNGGEGKHPRPIRAPGPGRSLSDEELHDHVAENYRFGRGGILHEKRQSRGVVGTTDAAMDHAKYIKELNERPALVLNADYQPLSYLPLSLWSWQDAVKAVFGGKVTVVDVYPEITIRAASLEIPLPSVIALTDYVSLKNQRPAFTRRNVFLRDEYRCQYCGNRFHTADLSLDHVHPRCMGGQLTWENAVTSCLKCNGKKGSLPVSQLRTIGMRLIREPRCPTQMELAANAARMIPKRTHPTWKPYLGIAEKPKPSSSSSSSSAGGDEEFIDDRYFEGV